MVIINLIKEKKLKKIINKNKKASLIVDRLLNSGYEVSLVGGAIRDKQQGVPLTENTDLDFATNASYDILLDLFKDLRIETVGESFKVAIIEGIEVASYRIDIYSGLSAKNVIVKAAKTIQEDLGRRDLTINALAYSIVDDKIIDLFGGVKDIQNRIIKFVGDPEQGIYEDPCRILRACRFLARLQGRFDPQTFEALKVYAHLVSKYVKPERIHLEIMKVLKYEKPSLFFQALHDIGLLQDIFPGLEKCYGHDGGPYHGETVFEHSMLAGDSIVRIYLALRLTGYLHDVGKPAVATFEEGVLRFINHENVGADIVRENLKALKFSNSDIDYVCNLIRCHMYSIGDDATPKAVRRFLKRLRDCSVDFEDWFLLKVADKTANLKTPNFNSEQLKKFRQKVEDAYKEPCAAFGVKDLAVNGDDVMSVLNIKPGSRIGRVLNNLLEIVLEDPSQNNRENLINLIKKG